jgi:hypothetical protein
MPLDLITLIPAVKYYAFSFMKVQLVSNLPLFRLRPFHLDSEIYAIYLALLYQIIMNILLQTMAYAALTQ